MIRIKRLSHPVTINKEPSKTDQSMAKECDVNEIMRKLDKTGQITHLRQGQGQYIDLSEVTDLLDCINTVQAAQESFMTLPAELRKNFNNSPQELIEFLQNPQNNEEAVRLGLKSLPKTSEQIVPDTTVPDESKRKRAQSQPTKDQKDGELP